MYNWYIKWTIRLIINAMITSTKRENSSMKHWLTNYSSDNKGKEL